MKSRNKCISKQGVIVLLLILFCMCLSACGTEPEYETYDFFLENGRGSYTYGELVMPETSKAVPLVFMAHGFKGTRNSGGAEELSIRLAKKGIAAVRIDFNPYAEADRKSERTRDYTLTTMTEDAVMAINHVLANFDVDEDRIGLHGRSMGGRAVMLLGNESRGGFDYKAMSLVAPAGNDSAMVYYMGGRTKWDEMKQVAAKEGFCEKQGLKLSYDWFTDFEENNPAKTGGNFGTKPVLVFYNTLDHVVLPETSMECADGYENAEVIEVTTEDGHGYEMSFETSELKEKIMEKIVDFFVENL